MLKPFKIDFSSLLVLAVVFAGNGAAQALKPQEIYQRLLPTVLTLKIVNTQGRRFTASAFLALQKDVAVTAWHAVQDAHYVYGLRADGARVEVKGLIDHDVAHDVALIRIDASDYSLAPLSDTPPMIGSQLYVMGAPKGFGFSIADGLLSQMQTIDGVEQYQMSCPLSTGNSGGPVVDERAQVVGVASWSRLDAQNINFAVPVEYVRSLNPSRPVVTWEDLEVHLAKTKTDSDASRLSQAEDDLEALREYLKRTAGRRITISVHEPEGNKDFTFVVPE